MDTNEFRGLGRSGRARPPGGPSWNTGRGLFQVGRRGGGAAVSSFQSSAFI